MKLTAAALRQMKSATPIAMLTAYTAPVARCLEKAGIPVILIGDSLGWWSWVSTAARGHHRADAGSTGGSRGAPYTHLIGDLTYGSDVDADTALHSARGLLDAGADSVKLEGAKLAVIAHLVGHGIDVVGHTGLTPQTAADFRQAGATDTEARRSLAESSGIADAGAFMVVLEHIPATLAERITRASPHHRYRRGALATGRCWSSTMRSGSGTTGRRFAAVRLRGQDHRGGGAGVSAGGEGWHLRQPGDAAHAGPQGRLGLPCRATPPPANRVLLGPLLLYAAASLVHFAHNAERLSLYPNLPAR
jgi:3-methyl-2-oxobutanoate hydroxymethyltransferase